jgi:hypothetical protein
MVFWVMTRCTLKKEAVCSYETLITFYKATHCPTQKGVMPYEASEYYIHGRKTAGSRKKALKCSKHFTADMGQRHVHATGISDEHL